MGTQPHKLQRVVANFAIDQHEVGPDMAIAMILPVAGQRMISAAFRQRLIGRQKVEDRAQKAVHFLAELPCQFPLVVAPETGGGFNLPH